MLQHHWNKPDLEARFPVNSVVRYSCCGLKHILGASGVVTGYSHTGSIKVRFGTYHVEVLPNNLIPLPKAQNPESDVIHPNHYILFDNVEAIEIIARSLTVEAFRGYCLGNILKYRLRAGKKSELATMEKDLKKAAFYQELFDKHKGLCYDAS